MKHKANLRVRAIGSIGSIFAVLFIFQLGNLQSLPIFPKTIYQPALETATLSLATSTATVIPSFTPTPTANTQPTAVYLVVATPLPSSFPEKYGSEIVTGIIGFLSALLLTQILPPTIKWIRSQKTRLYQRFRTERYYCNKVANDLRQFKILGMAKPRDIGPLFIPLKIREFVSRETIDTRDASQKTTLNFEDALARYSNIVILGDPGAGKTTLSRHATVLCAERQLVINGITYFPIYISLNDVKLKMKTSETSDVEFEDILSNELKTYGFPDGKDYLIRQLKEGSCLLVLDGFDEIANEKLQEKIAQLIRQLTRSYHQNNRVVLTSRMAGFRGALFPTFIALEIIELPFEEAKVFIKGWFIDDLNKANKLITIVEKNRRLKLLADNPLMLAVICLTYQNREKLEERKVDLYEQCIDTLITVWDSSRGVDREPMFDEERKWVLLENIAFDFHVAHQTDFTERELLAAIRKHLDKANEKPYKADDYLKEILEHTGIIRQKARDVFSFQHLTFQEYLAARVLAKSQGDEFKFILENLAESWWREIIILVAGILRDATSMLQAIYEKAKKHSIDDLYLLLGKCLTDADLTDIELKDEILSNVVALAYGSE